MRVSVRHALLVLIICVAGCKNEGLNTVADKTSKGTSPKVIEDLSKIPSKLIRVLEKLSDVERQNSILPSEDLCSPHNPICSLATEIGRSAVEAHIGSLIDNLDVYLDLLKQQQITFLYVADPQMELLNEPQGDIPAGVLLLEEGVIDPRRIVVYEMEEVVKFGPFRLCEITGHEVSHLAYDDVSLSSISEERFNTIGTLLCALDAQYEAEGLYDTVKPPEEPIKGPSFTPGPTVDVYRFYVAELISSDPDVYSGRHLYKHTPEIPDNFIRDDVLVRLYKESQPDCDLHLVMCTSQPFVRPAVYRISFGKCLDGENLNSLGYGCRSNQDTDLGKHIPLYMTDNGTGDRLVVDESEKAIIEGRSPEYQFSANPVVWVPDFSVE